MVVFGRRTEGLCAWQFFRKVSRLVDQDRQALRANVDLFTLVLHMKQWLLQFGFAAIETDRIFHGSPNSLITKALVISSA
jgi:hypothetical protein